MAPESHVHVNIDDDVEFLSEQIERLRYLAEQKEASDVFGDEDVYDLSIRWGTALAGRLPRMAHYSSIGLLSDADERRFQSLCHELQAVGPLIQRFNLARPNLTGRRDDHADDRKRRSTKWRRPARS
ncbi:hypothetical protein BST39_06950 [Mycobacterium paraseoulense]|uniref:Uncharacterized protein n=2 Tax=Mycobacterium paraseoulense TaxID=590652 RepID=A0A1X0IEJ4_9MYCO|nr:hypothetical protein BST39_06950 [Mycobacterium paraseoulense]